jgi:hypothetical protein
MTNFFKGFAFLVFGVVFSPILLGMGAPLVAWELSHSVLAVVVATVVWFSAWAAAREWMIARKWHYYLT